MYIHIPDEIDTSNLLIKETAILLFKHAVHVKSITRTTYLQLWEQFSKWAANRCLLYIDQVDKNVVESYVKDLVISVNKGTIGSHNVQSRLAAINTIMRTTHEASGKEEWGQVTGRNNGLPPRTNIRRIAPENLDRYVYVHRLNMVSIKVGLQEAAVVEICREFGFTCQEAVRYDARTDFLRYKKNKNIGKESFVRAWDGVKFSKRRMVPITTEEQTKALERATIAQGKRLQIMSDNITYRQWRDVGLRGAAEIMGGFIDLRSAYACERFSTLTGFNAPCTGEERPEYDTFVHARLVVGKELGIRYPQSMDCQIGSFNANTSKEQK